jgi:uncharacterized protein (DUF111 family)
MRGGFIIRGCYGKVEAAHGIVEVKRPQVAELFREIEGRAS